jgi:hypothetical protein
LAKLETDFAFSVSPEARQTKFGSLTAPAPEASMEGWVTNYFFRENKRRKKSHNFKPANATHLILQSSW